VQVESVEGVNLMRCSKEAGVTTLTCASSASGRLEVAAILEILQALSVAWNEDGTKLLVLHIGGIEVPLGDAPPRREDALALRLQLQGVLNLLRTAPFVSVAVIRGRVHDAAADLALACDYRLLDPEGMIGFPNTRVQPLLPGRDRLTQLAGADRAFDLLLRCRELDALAALALGLVNEVADGGSARAFVDALRVDVEGIGRSSIAILREAIAGSGEAALQRIPRSIAAGPASSSSREAQSLHKS